MSARALSLLAGLASPIFLAAAVAGWLYGVWPANPVTLGVAAFLVVSGPVLGMYHVATAREDWDEDEDEEPAFVAAPAPVMTVSAARAKAFHNWRDSVNPAIERRERERRANRYLRARG